MFDDDHEDGDDDHDYRDDDYGDGDDAHDEGGNGDDDDDGVCSQCGRDDGNPSSWKRPPTRIPPPPSLSVSASRFSSSQERERESSAFQTTCTLRPDTGRVVVVVGGALRHRAPAKTGPLSAKACLSLLVRRSLAGNFAVETARQPHPDSAANRARSESPLQTFTLFCRRLI